MLIITQSVLESELCPDLLEELLINKAGLYSTIVLGVWSYIKVIRLING